MNDYIGNAEDDSDLVLINTNYSYRATCNIPHTYEEVITFSKAHCWIEAMQEEIEFLKENNVFELTHLLEGKKTVSNKWVYSTKENREEPVKLLGNNQVAIALSRDPVN